MTVLPRGRQALLALALAPAWAGCEEHPTPVPCAWMAGDTFYTSNSCRDRTTPQEAPGLACRSAAMGWWTRVAVGPESELRAWLDYVPEGPDLPYDPAVFTMVVRPDGCFQPSPLWVEKASDVLLALDATYADGGFEVAWTGSSGTYVARISEHTGETVWSRQIEGPAVWQTILRWLALDDLRFGVWMSAEAAGQTKVDVFDRSGNRLASSYPLPPGGLANDAAIGDGALAITFDGVDADTRGVTILGASRSLPVVAASIGLYGDGISLEPAIAWDGNAFLVSFWTNESPRQVWAGRLSSTGDWVDAPRPVAEGLLPAVSALGNRALLAYQLDSMASTSPYCTGALEVRLLDLPSLESVATAVVGTAPQDILQLGVTTASDHFVVSSTAWVWYTDSVHAMEVGICQSPFFVKVWPDGQFSTEIPMQ